MWTIDAHRIRDPANPTSTCTVKMALANVESLCAPSETTPSEVTTLEAATLKAVRPLLRQLFGRIVSARDTLAQAHASANEDARKRFLRAFEDIVVAFANAQRLYCGKPFVEQVLYHEQVIKNVEKIHFDLDALSKDLHNDKNRAFDWDAAFKSEVATFRRAIESSIRDPKTVELYRTDSRIALEAAILLELARTNSDRLLWQDNPLAQLLSDENPGWRETRVPDWFIRESTVTLMHRFDRGSFGVVHRGTWGSGTNVVVKRMILDDGASHALIRDQMREEADLWFKLTHPSVLRMFGACHAAAFPFFVSEDATEGHLRDYLSATKSMMWRQLHQVALAIEYLHGKGIVHGDLKLNNVFVLAHGQARLADFGLSHKHSSSGSPIAKAGALGWRAPEALDGTVIFESDVYSFAMCIIEALTGSDPYEECTNEITADRIRCTLLPELPLDTPNEVRDLISQMTKHAPSERMKIVDVTLSLKELANKEIQEAIHSKKICQQCQTVVQNGAAKCHKCAQDSAVPGSLVLGSKDELPLLLQMATLSDGRDGQNVVKTLSDYLRSHPEDWLAVVEAGAIPTLCGIIHQAQDSEFATDALKSLGLLIMASQTPAATTGAEVTHRNMSEILKAEGVLELFRAQLTSDSEARICTAIKTLGFWPSPDQVRADMKAMDQIRVLTKKPASEQVRRSAMFALKALASDAPAAA